MHSSTKSGGNHSSCFLFAHLIQPHCLIYNDLRTFISLGNKSDQNDSVRGSPRLDSLYSLVLRVPRTTPSVPPASPPQPPPCTMGPDCDLTAFSLRSCDQTHYFNCPYQLGSGNAPVEVWTNPLYWPPDFKHFVWPPRAFQCMYRFRVFGCVFHVSCVCVCVLLSVAHLVCSGLWDPGKGRADQG